MTKTIATPAMVKNEAVKMVFNSLSSLFISTSGKFVMIMSYKLFYVNLNLFLAFGA